MNFGSPILAAFANAARRQAPRPVMDDPVGEADAVPIQVTNAHPAIATTVSDQATVKRRLQCVSTKASKIRVLHWMQEQATERGTEKNLMSDTVRHFPEVFRAQSYTTNLMKCSRWWKEKESLFQDFEWDQKSLSHSYPGWRKRVELKARPGRGRKTSPWNGWLYPLIRSEFDRLRKSGVKFSPDILLLMAKNILLSSSHPTFSPSMVLPTTGKTFLDNVTARWVQQFSETQGIVHRTQTGKLQVSPEKQIFIEHVTAYHMGQLARGFANGDLNEDLLENMDETHFVVNMDNGKTLGFRGDTEVKYADVVSGGLGITMVVKVTGGRTGKISTPMLIFQNTQSSYPIQGTPDNVNGVCYRSSPSSFMTTELLTEYYSEPRISWPDPSERTKIQFIDNCPGHNQTRSCEEALTRIRTQLRYFPANSTHLTQPCDSFVISKIKDAWRRQWDAKKMDMIASHMWQGDGRDGISGNLKNPGWGYFLQLVADSVRDVNAQRDEHHGISYARKAMIRCGLSLNVDGTWDVKQLTPQLQECISKYRGNFEGSNEGLEPTARPRRARRSNLQGEDMATAPTDGTNVVVSQARTRGRRRAEASPTSDSVDGSSMNATHAEGSGSGAPTAATTWAASQLGARVHRNKARRAQQVSYAVFEDAQGPENVDIEGTAELNLDSDVWGYLETQYDMG